MEHNRNILYDQNGSLGAVICTCGIAATFTRLGDSKFIKLCEEAAYRNVKERCALSAVPADQGMLTDEQIDVLSEVYDDAVLEKWPSKRFINHLRMCPCFFRRPSPAPLSCPACDTGQSLKRGEGTHIEGTNELKACPGCERRNDGDDEVVACLPAGRRFRCVCSCGWQGPAETTREKAVAAWNQRVLDGALVEAALLAKDYYLGGRQKSVGLAGMDRLYRAKDIIDAALRSAGVEP